MAQKKNIPQNIVCMFEATVPVTVENTVYAENAAREALKNQPDLWKLASLYRKKGGRP